MLVRWLLDRLDRRSLKSASEPRKTSSTIRTRKTANNVRPLSIVSVPLYVLSPPFSIYLSSAGLPTGMLYGNVSECYLFPSKYTYILLRYTKNRLCILVTLGLVCTSILGIVYPPSYTLYPGCLWICKLPRLDPLWIRLDNSPVNSAEPSLERLRNGIVYILRLDTYLNAWIIDRTTILDDNTSNISDRNAFLTNLLEIGARTLHVYAR